MHIFVTGATGFIGQAVLRELIQAGHTVTGLARSDENVETLKILGAQAHRGSIEDLDALKSAAAASDGVIHLAFNHDFSDFAGSCAKDRAAIEAMGSALEGTNKPFIATSGTLGLHQSRLGDEDETFDVANPLAALRGASETTALSFAEKGVKASVIRLAPTNHGEGDHGFIPQLFKIAEEKGKSAYIGEGSNVWPAVARLDTAKLFQLAIEKAAAGSRAHAVAEEGVTTKSIAEAIGKAAGVPAVSIAAEEAQGWFGFLGFALQLDNPCSSEKTRSRLGWEPTQRGLIGDIEGGLYTK